jgi:glycosyltransferase involved in cell wall biosynthesis
MSEVIIVLGMHRSGTSVLSRSLNIFGFKHGNKLLEKGFDNPKGYFEDYDIVELNDKILKKLNINWNLFFPTVRYSFSKNDFIEYTEEAVLLLQRKINLNPFFIIKDPRLCRLLFFWKNVFKILKIKTFYVFSIRDPINIALSLKKRNNFYPEQAFMLWFEYLLFAVNDTLEEQTVFIEYDKILDFPKKEIERIGTILNIKNRINNLELKNFTNSFLDSNLNHHRLIKKNNNNLPLKYLKFHKYLLEYCSLISYQKSSISIQFFKDLYQSYINEDHFFFSFFNNITQVTQVKEQEIVNLTQVTQAKDREINEILNSTCWKITLPIRIIGSFLRRITIFTKKAYEYFLLVKKEIKNKNIINIIKLVIKVFIKSGFNGLKHSLVELKKKNNFSYYQWILDNEILTKDEERFLKNKILNFKYKPLVSIVMPVYNSDIGFLEQAINSVLKQSYNNWELCIADDFSSNKNVSLILKKFEKKDNRIKVVYRKSNGHISEASNSALKIAQGEWITFLDHDDMLNEHALFYIVNSINDNPNIKLIYSDEDKILENTSLRGDPYFKTDWNRELFYGQNYIIHVACYKTDIINAIGGFRVEFEGSQDYDLTLRYIEKIQDHEISHVPRILYHWRISDLSTSKNIQNKKYSVTNGIKALNEHLNRIGIEATTEIVHGQYYKINYSLPKDLPLVTIIIPTKNNYLYLKKCIDSILEKTTYLNYEILIINNNSTDENILSYLSELSLNYKIQVILDSTSPFNYSLINNNAVAMASGDLICFMNDDTEVISNNWLAEMVSLTLQKNVAFVGCKLLYADNTIQHAGVVLGLGGLAGHAFKYFPSTSPGYFFRALLTSEYSAVTAACTLIKKEIFLKLKGFDPDNLKVAFNDVDICIKAIDKGYRNIFTPFALLYHYESKSRGYDVASDQKKRAQNELLYVSKKWNKYIFSDKCYSPNLTLNCENFSYDKSRVPKII